MKYDQGALVESELADCLKCDKTTTNRYCETRAVDNSKDFAQFMRQRLIAVDGPNHLNNIFYQLADFDVYRVLCLMNFAGMPFATVKESLPRLASERATVSAQKRRAV